MIAVDTNLLIYAHREDSDFHRPALALLLELANRRDSWSIPWPCLHEFLAIATHPRIFDPPSPTSIALAAMEAWLSTPSCEMLGEGPGYFEVLGSLLERGKVAGPMIHDARIAALCLYHDVHELWSADRDFSRFGSLRTRNPLTDS